MKKFKTNLKKLHLGCGDVIKKDFVNLDVAKLPGVDVVWNLNKFPYPFEDNTFEYVEAIHVMEHLDDKLKPLDEIWRICKNKAIVHIEVPNYNSYLAAIDPTHKQFFNFFTYDVISVTGKRSYYLKAKFRVKRKYVRGLRLIPTTRLKVLLNKVFGNIVTDLIFELEMIK
jgi:SAM-dependent methyltransferase